MYIIVFTECEENVCENGAGCKLLAGNFICECPPDYNGAFCEEKGTTAHESYFIHLIRRSFQIVD
jgi:hypothetical protein